MALHRLDPALRPPHRKIRKSRPKILNQTLRGRDRDAWNEASRLGFHGDNQPMAKLLKRSLEPSSPEKRRDLFLQKCRERDARRADKVQQRNRDRER
jgi:hypothetical protein